MTVGQSQILFNKFIDELPPPTPRKEIKGDSINTTKLTTKTSASPKKVDAEKHTEAIDNHISKSSEHRPKVDLRPPVSEPEPNAAHEVPTKKLTKPNPDNVQSEPQSVADNAAAITAKAFFGALCPMILALFTVVFL
uniref:Uncharacterized protein n=1 Tax=Plectus sambesii TaxID=2011161 RepID=A0A914UP61_9BILA